ncbi:S1 RNA-binding domain-containing protein [bacterium]|nr:S1 RNA-binding domain-containing protein [bacterium]
MVFEKDKNNEWDDSMGMTMEEFDQAISGSFAGDDLHAGDKVTGTIISISETSVFLDISAKSEGIIALEEFVDEDGKLTIKLGDEISATVIRIGNEIQLSHKMRKRDQTLEMLREAYSGQIAVEGRVNGVNKGGFEISLGDKEAFCPVSQIDIDYVEDPNIHTGCSYHFLITKMDPKGRNIVVSRTKLLEEERAKLALDTMKTLEPGIIVSGEIRRITDFGAFVDIGGVDGLVHISQLSWDRVHHPSEIVETGQEVQVKVLKIDPDSKRIALSIREVMQKPWDEFVGSEIIEGNLYKGKVSRVEHFGAFVRLKPGLEGLLHISELKYGQRINHPSEIVSVDDVVEVKIIGLDQEKQRISLSLKQTGSDPWDLHATSLVADTYLQAEIARVKKAGVEVLLDSNLLGFVPASMSSVSQGESLQNTYKPGDSVRVRIVEADRETRRLILEIVNAETEQNKTDVAKYLAETPSQTNQGFGNLGAALQKAMNKKDNK